MESGLGHPQGTRGAGAEVNIKALRHYPASQLLAGGIDSRNTAARRGHGGGGATTLRHYADPVSGVDRRAAVYVARLTAPPANSADAAFDGSELARLSDDADAPSLESALRGP